MIVAVIIAVARAVWVIINAIYNDRKSTLPASLQKIATVDWHYMFCQSITLTAFSRVFLIIFFFFLIPPHHFTRASFLFPTTYRFTVVLCIFARGAHNESRCIMVLRWWNAYCACPPASQVAAEVGQRQWKHSLNTNTAYCNRFKWALWHFCINAFSLL